MTPSLVEWAVLVAAVMFVIQGMWAFYMIQVQKRKALGAGAASSTITGMSAFVVLTYVQQPMLVVAAMIGAFLGAFSVTYLKRRDRWTRFMRRLRRSRV